MELVIEVLPHVEQLIRYAKALGTTYLRLYPPNVLWFMDSSMTSAGFTEISGRVESPVMFELPYIKESEIELLERIEVKDGKAFFVFKNKTIDVDVEKDTSDPKMLIDLTKKRHEYGWLDLRDSGDVLSELRLMKFSELGDVVAIDFYNGVLAVGARDRIPSTTGELKALVKEGEFYDLWNATVELRDFYVNVRVPSLSAVDARSFDDIVRRLKSPDFIYLYPTADYFGPVVFLTARKDSNHNVYVIVAPVNLGELVEEYYKMYHKLPENVRDLLAVRPEVREEIEKQWEKAIKELENLIKQIDELIGTPEWANLLMAEVGDAINNVRAGRVPKGVVVPTFPSLQSVLKNIEELRRLRRKIESALAEVKERAVRLSIFENVPSVYSERVTSIINFLREVLNTARLINHPEEFKELIKSEVPELLKKYNEHKTLSHNLYSDFLKKYPVLKGTTFYGFFVDAIRELIEEGVLERTGDGIVRLVEEKPKVGTEKLSEEERGVLSLLVLEPLTEQTVRAIMEHNGIDPSVLDRLIAEGYIERTGRTGRMLKLTEKGYGALGGKDKALCEALERVLKNAIESYRRGHILPRHYGEVPEKEYVERAPAQCRERIEELRAQIAKAIGEFFREIEALGIKSITQLESALKKLGFAVKVDKQRNTYRIVAAKGSKELGATITCYPDYCNIYLWGDVPVPSVTYYGYPRHIAYGLVYYYAKRLLSGEGEEKRPSLEEKAEEEEESPLEEIEVPVKVHGEATELPLEEVAKMATQEEEDLRFIRRKLADTWEGYFELHDVRPPEPPLELIERLAREVYEGRLTQPRAMAIVMKEARKALPRARAEEAKEMLKKALRPEEGRAPEVKVLEPEEEEAVVEEVPRVERVEERKPGPTPSDRVKEIYERLVSSLDRRLQKYNIDIDVVLPDIERDLWGLAEQVAEGQKSFDAAVLDASRLTINVYNRKVGRVELPPGVGKAPAPKKVEFAEEVFEKGAPEAILVAVPRWVNEELKKPETVAWILVNGLSQWLAEMEERYPDASLYVDYITRWLSDNVLYKTVKALEKRLESHPTWADALALYILKNYGGALIKGGWREVLRRGWSWIKSWLKTNAEAGDPYSRTALSLADYYVCMTNDPRTGTTKEVLVAKECRPEQSRLSIREMLIFIPIVKALEVLGYDYTALPWPFDKAYEAFRSELIKRFRG